MIHRRQRTAMPPPGGAREPATATATPAQAPSAAPTASRDDAPNAWVTGAPTLHANLAGGCYIYHRIGNDDVGQAVTVQIDGRGRALLQGAGIAPGRRIPEPLVWKLRQLRCFYLLGAPAPAAPARRGPARSIRQDPTRQR
ncbi:MAG: hypothetical protein ACKOWF_02865 [Chloroflexota bacterium]